MSHILTEYSKNLEVKPSSVVVNKHFYPVIPENYIVIYNEQDVDSKCYNYYSLVVDLIRTDLNKQDLRVVVIGSESNITDRSDYSYPGLSFRKNAYIVSKAKLLISVDNAITQYASSQDVPIVNLYGNIYPSITTAFWSSKKNKIDLEPDWDVKPCMSVSDPEQSIDKIKAERVAISCLKLLHQSKTGGKKTFLQNINFKTKLINKNKSSCIDVIPSNYVNSHIFDDQVLNIRLDLGKIQEDDFYKYLSNHKCSIILKDSFLQIDSIKRFAENIKDIKVITTEKPDTIPSKYFSILKSLGINFSFLVKNKEILDDIRFEYFDEVVEYYDPPTKKPEFVGAEDYFFSFKYVVEGGKVYNSTYHWKKNLDSEDNIVDNPDYWEELDYFYIYEQKRGQK